MINLTAFKKIFNKKEKVVSNNYLISYKDLAFRYDYTDSLNKYPKINDEGKKYYSYNDGEAIKVLIEDYKEDIIDNYIKTLRDNEFIFDEDNDNYAYKEIDDKKYVVSINKNLLNDDYIDITYFIDNDEDDENDESEYNDINLKNE